jgi:hypothetical protein
MLGFFGMIMVFLAIICLLSYWISWDLQHQQTRPGFGKHIRNDIAVSLQRATAKRRREVRQTSVGHGFAQNATR